MAKKKKFDYFDAFGKISAQSVKAADYLVETVSNFESAEKIGGHIDTMHEIEHAGDVVNHEIFRAAAVDFVTPIEREDIIELAQQLDDIIDCIEEVMLSFYKFDIHFMHEDVLEFVQLIRKSCVALDESMEDFRNFKKTEAFSESMVKINDYEEECDRLLIKVIRNLHTVDRENPMRVYVWSQIFEGLEKCADACEQAADSMATVMLKNL